MHALGRARLLRAPEGVADGAGSGCGEGFASGAHGWPTLQTRPDPEEAFGWDDDNLVLTPHEFEMVDGVMVVYDTPQRASQVANPPTPHTQARPPHPVCFVLFVERARPLPLPQPGPAISCSPSCGERSSLAIRNVHADSAL